MIQSGHNFAHAMTAQLSWHVLNGDLISLLFFMQEQHNFYKNDITSVLSLEILVASDCIK